MRRSDVERSEMESDAEFGSEVDDELSEAEMARIRQAEAETEAMLCGRGC